MKLTLKKRLFLVLFFIIVFNLIAYFISVQAQLNEVIDSYENNDYIQVTQDVIRNITSKSMELNFTVGGGVGGLSTDVSTVDDGYVAQFLSGHAQKIFYDVGRWWVFYLGDNRDFNFTSSTDGKNWNTPTKIGRVWDSSVQYKMAIYFNGTYVEYVWMASGQDIRYRKGIPQSDGSISWLAVQQSITPLYTCARIMITVNSSGHAWIAYNDWRYLCYITNNKLDGTWVTGYNVMEYDGGASRTQTNNGLVLISNGTMLHWWELHESLPFYRSIWNPVAESFGVDSNLPFRSEKGGRYVHVLSDTKDNVLFAYMELNNYDLQLYNMTDDTIVELETQTDNNIYQLGVHATSNDIYAFYERMSDNIVYYRKYTGGVWEARVEVYNEGSDTGDWTAITRYSYGDRIGFLWQHYNTSLRFRSYGFAVSGQYVADGVFYTKELLSGLNGTTYVLLTNVTSNTGNIKVQFSPNNITWVDHNNVTDGSDTLVDGYEAIDLRDCNFTNGYIRFNYTRGDLDKTPRLFDIRLIYYGLPVEDATGSMLVIGIIVGIILISGIALKK